jgi:HlyD family secretion protein
MSGMGPGMGAGMQAWPAGQGAARARSAMARAARSMCWPAMSSSRSAVQFGITDNRNTEVVGGDLKEGDRIVTGENGSNDKKPSSVGMRMF